MPQTRDYRPAIFLILSLGLSEAAAASVVPFYNAGYELDAFVLLAVLMPSLLWGLFIGSLRGAWLAASGLVLLAISLALIVPERYLHYNGYVDDRIYWIPTLAAAIVLPLAYAFGRRAPQA